MLSKINQSVWSVFFRTSHFFNDNVAFAIVIFSIFFGVLFSLLIRKKKYLGVLDGIYLFSVYDMLNKLPLIHTRIHNALASVSSIIMMSDSYQQSFYQATGIFPRKTSEIVYYLYSRTPKQLSEMGTIHPTMLYQKLYSTFQKCRYFFGYVDDQLSPGFYGVLGLLCIATFFFFFRKGEMRFAIIHMLLLLLFFFIGQNGCILALFVLVITHLGMHWLSKEYIRAGNLSNIS